MSGFRLLKLNVFPEFLQSINKRQKEMAEKEGVSMNQLITLAVSEKASALLKLLNIEENGSG